MKDEQQLMNELAVLKARKFDLIEEQKIIDMRISETIGAIVVIRDIRQEFDLVSKKKEVIQVPREMISDKKGDSLPSSSGSGVPVKT